VAIRRTLLLLAALLLLLTRPGLAQDNGKKDEGPKKTRERWEKLDEEHREKRRKLFEGKTEAEKEEILRKLKELGKKSKKDRDRLHDKHRRMRELEERLKKAMPDRLRKRIDQLDEKLRRSLLYYTMGRIWEVGREQFVSSLTDAEKQEFEGLSGRAQHRKTFEIIDRRIQANLSLDDRKRLEAMPAADRRKKTGELRSAAIRRGMKEAGKKVFVEIEKLLDRPKELDAVLEKARSRWGKRRGGPRRHGQRDPELHRLIEALPEAEREKAWEKYRGLRGIRDEAKRKKAVEEFKAGLRKRKPD